MIEQKIKLQKKKLIIEIVLEYLFALFMFFLFPYILLYISDIMIGDNTGIDGIGQALGVVIILRLFKYAIVLATGIIYPIVIMILYFKSLYRKSISKIKSVIYIILIIIPILISLSTVFEVQISNFMYDMKYESSTSAYTVKKEDYKSTKDFYKELKTRDLLYSEETKVLEDKLNGDHDCLAFNSHGSVKCYSPSTMYGMDKEYFYDDPSKEDIIDLDVKYPYYIYNAILTLPDENGDLQYTALGQFSYNAWTKGDYEPLFKDFYIECKILYVDGQMYAIIGVSENYNLDKYYDETIGEEYKSRGDYSGYYHYVKPHYMILSEKDTITTYFDEKYHSNGAISVDWEYFEMAPNTNGVYLHNSYPIRKVDKLDKKTINKIAKELQEDILKEPIKYHYEYLRKKSKQ